jgi:tetratricopeptide (TPR) repeat protein
MNHTPSQPAQLSDLERTVRAHMTHYAELLRRTAPGLRGRTQAAALHVLRLEEANILAALDNALARGDVAALTNIARHWWLYADIAGKALESGKRYELVEAAARQLGSDGLLLAALQGLSKAQFRTGRLDEARASAHSIIKLAQARGSVEEEARARISLAWVAYYKHELDVAEEHAREGLELYRGLREPQAVASALNCLGCVLMTKRNLSAARETLAESVRSFGAAGDRHSMASALGNLALVDIELGRPQDGRRSMEESLEIFTALNSRYGMAMGYGNLGGLEADEGNFAEARVMFERSLELAREIGDRRMVAMLLRLLGRHALETGDLEAARGYVERVLEALAVESYPEVLLETLRLAGELCAEAGLRAHSVVLHSGARSEAENIGFNFGDGPLRGMQATLDAAREALGEELYARHVAEGEGMTQSELLLRARSALYGIRMTREVRAQPAPARS